MAKVLLTLVSLCLCVTMTTGVIFTSSHKVSRVTMNEDRILAKLKQIIDKRPDVTLEQSYAKLLSESKGKSLEQKKAELGHPNGFYFIIKRFAIDYPSQLGAPIQDELMTAMLHVHNPIMMPTNEDLEGALEGLLRLQKIYKLPARHLVQGNYSGHLGPSLGLDDVFLLSQRAFSQASLSLSLDLINLALELKAKGPSEASMMGLKGRALVLLGKDKEAKEVFVEANHRDPLDGEVLTLAQFLKDQPRVQKEDMDAVSKNFTRLCQYDEPYHIERPDYQAMKCRYKPSLLPYYVFKEEILAASPYISLFYDVFSNTEKQQLKDSVDRTLTRGLVSPVGAGSSESNLFSGTRTSDVAFIRDRHPTIARLSQRVGHITGMSMKHQIEGLHPMSAEGFQVVNYGLAGHYYVHHDAFPVDDASGNRLATFLVYLNTVEKGGNTVFTEAGVSVAAREDTVLYWYSYSPAFNKSDKMTYHAGCPVLVGEKWIANKWIRSYGNSYHRPCGLTEETPQLDIEKVMDANLRNIVTSGL